jgi:hypothetical protein
MEGMAMMEPIRHFKKEEEEFWQKLTSPVEECTGVWARGPWDGSYRWFSSPNVVRLELYRTTEDMKRICGILLNPARGLPRVVPPSNTATATKPADQRAMDA